MNFEVIVSERVHRQLVNVLDWYSENAPGHEIKLLKSFDKSLASIQKKPLKCQIRYEKVRVYFLDTYKYGIHYSIENQMIFIVGFFHQHQASENWSMDKG